MRLYLGLQQSGLVHADIILTLHSFDGQDAPLRHRPDLQDAYQTQSGTLRQIRLPFIHLH